jgi:hypothetical protein
MYEPLCGGSMSDDYNEEMTEKMTKEEKKLYGDYESKCRAERDADVIMEYGEITGERKEMAMACLENTGAG